MEMVGHGKEDRIWEAHRALEKENSWKYDQDFLHIFFFLLLNNFSSMVGVGISEKKHTKK